jgi:DNA-binding response OmpR family regulator
MPEPNNAVHNPRGPRLADNGTLIHMKHQNGQAQRAPRCLVIDDTPDVRQAVASMLTRLGYQVDSAATKAEVTSSLAGCQYELIVTDLEMPDMSGYHLAITLKTVNRESRVVIMTGRHPSDCTAMMRTGWADEWLFKPFGLKQLRQTIEACGGVGKSSNVAGCGV